MKAYDSVLASRNTIAARNSFVISPKGEILYSYSDMNPNDHVANTMAVVKKYKESGGKKG